MLPQLVMRRHALTNLPVLDIPENCEIRSMQPGEEGVWERIVSDAFGNRISIDMMRRDTCYTPERIYFVLENGVAMATASAWVAEEAPEWGTIHMVASLRGAGGGAGRRAVLAALGHLKREGFEKARLTTDDFRLPAIRSYEKLGFIRDASAPGMEERWQRIDHNIRQYRSRNADNLLIRPGTILKPFFLAGEGNACVIVCPGGGYGMKAPHEAEPIATAMNRLGYSAAVLDYHVAPHRHPEPLLDLQRALRHVRTHADAYGIRPDRVAILGFSAGGHLCALGSVHHDPGNPQAEDAVERFSCRPDASILCYPVVDFHHHRHEGTVANLLGDAHSPGEVPDFFCPNLCVTPDTPPMFLWHTADDQAVHVSHSLGMARALAEHKIPFALHVFPHGPHGLGLAPQDDTVGQWIQLLGQWLGDLWPKA